MPRRCSGAPPRRWPGRRPTVPPTGELLKVLNGDVARGGTVTLNLHDLIAQVAAGTGLPAGVADRLPANLQQLQVLKTDKIEAAQKALKTAKTLVIVIIVVAVLLMAGAIALSTDRRRTVVACGGCVLFAGVAVLALRRRRRRRRGQRARRGPERAAGGQGRVHHRDVAAHRRRVGLDRVRPLPGHGRVAGRLRAARDGDAARERPGAARPPDLLPRRAGPPAAAARGLGARCRGRARSGRCWSSRSPPSSGWSACATSRSRSSATCRRASSGAAGARARGRRSEQAPQPGAG